jgi:hypothetical protein
LVTQGRLPRVTNPDGLDFCHRQRNIALHEDSAG